MNCWQVHAERHEHRAWECAFPSGAIATVVLNEPPSPVNATNYGDVVLYFPDTRYVNLPSAAYPRNYGMFLVSGTPDDELLSFGGPILYRFNQRGEILERHTTRNAYESERFSFVEYDISTAGLLVAYMNDLLLFEHDLKLRWHKTRQPPFDQLGWVEWDKGEALFILEDDQLRRISLTTGEELLPEARSDHCQ